MQVSVTSRSYVRALLDEHESNAHLRLKPAHRELKARHRFVLGTGSCPDKQVLSAASFLDRGESIKDLGRPPDIHPELVYGVPRGQRKCLCDQSTDC